MHARSSWSARRIEGLASARRLAVVKTGAAKDPLQYRLDQRLALEIGTRREQQRGVARDRLAEIARLDCQQGARQLRCGLPPTAACLGGGPCVPPVKPAG